MSTALELAAPFFMVVVIVCGAACAIWGFVLARRDRIAKERQAEADRPERDRLDHLRGL